MIELRPLLVPGDAPLLLAIRPRNLREGSVRPLIRGVLLTAILSAALGLPALRSSAADRTAPVEHREAQRAGLAVPQKDGTRVALVRGTFR